MLFGDKRKFCFSKGQFYVIADTLSKGRSWIALGPDRKISVPFSIVLILCVIPTIYLFRYTESTGMAVVILFTYIICTTSYFYTSLLDPGIIRREEDNSLENKPTLEPLGYTFCTICGLYRPPHSYHCSFCNVCYLEHDHHCTFMGQCVAKNNKVSFYIFLASLLIYLILSEVCAMSMLSIRHSASARNFSILVASMRDMFKSSRHLRS